MSLYETKPSKYTLDYGAIITHEELLEAFNNPITSQYTYNGQSKTKYHFTLTTNKDIFHKDIIIDCFKTLLDGINHCQPLPIFNLKEINEYIDFIKTYKLYFICIVVDWYGYKLVDNYGNFYGLQTYNRRVQLPLSNQIYFDISIGNELFYKTNNISFNNVLSKKQINKYKEIEYNSVSTCLHSNISIGNKFHIHTIYKYNFCDNLKNLSLLGIEKEEEEEEEIETYDMNTQTDLVTVSDVVDVNAITGMRENEADSDITFNMDTYYDNIIERQKNVIINLRVENSILKDKLRRLTNKKSE